MTNAAEFWAKATPQERAAAQRSATGPQASRGLTEPLVFDRLFTTCRAFSSENKMHYYQPPFGLHAYDDRFKDGVEKLHG